MAKPSAVCCASGCWSREEYNQQRRCLPLKYPDVEEVQLAVGVSDLGGGDAVSRDLKDNGLIVNPNLLPFAPLDQFTNPAGLRLGVKVTVAHGAYEAVQIVTPPQMNTDKVISALVNRIRESGHLSMDAVTGATITSAAVLKAVQLAVSRKGN